MHQRVADSDEVSTPLDGIMAQWLPIRGPRRADLVMQSICFSGGRTEMRLEKELKLLRGTHDQLKIVFARCNGVRLTH
eukprot:CAMPEP_0115870016 /NCGR_PEP_ID=MMETSP0287-20121206/22104_1 /TAXON_ID=412157 /ORGANISM="Chrysochromulina rotalis, Strain UIO044" /LENGTH=77 /DNA_ID=CAMNT_0003324715 /DNA_START=460 /DNA_END=693 /DNA_ORIENTATION=-